MKLQVSISSRRSSESTLVNAAIGTLVPIVGSKLEYLEVTSTPAPTPFAGEFQALVQGCPSLFHLKLTNLQLVSLDPLISAYETGPFLGLAPATAGSKKLGVFHINMVSSEVEEAGELLALDNSSLGALAKMLETNRSLTELLLTTRGASFGWEDVPLRPFMRVFRAFDEQDVPVPATIALVAASLPTIVVADAAPLDFGDLGDLPPLLPNDTDKGPHDHRFKPGPPPPGKKGPRGEFSVRGPGGRLQLCPSADCNGTVIDLVAHHLVEMTADRKPTKNHIKGFGGANLTWSTPTTKLNADGVNVTSSVAVANFTLAGYETPVRYKAEVAFYHGNATAKNGEQIIDVPGGSLKFAVWIDDWPFLSDSNMLHLGYRVVARKPAGGKMDKAEAKRGRGRDKKVDRMQLLEGMFLDSPSLAQVDGAMVTINSTLIPTPNSVVVDYAFPKFKSLYYDPVMGADDATTGDAPTPTPTLRSAAWPLSGALRGAALAAVLGAVLL
ncbi:hypothetical protein ATCC90586_000389 [Pythium insidiosum]|nr:hypothetical protein ATCC90586_000389 [Pythium insidiosum]